MAHRPRKEMIAETRAKLVGAARQAFGSVGYADASMDDFTAAAGLTRGALYHHFGDKKGLLQAVIAEIDDRDVAAPARHLGQGQDPWHGFVDENIAYIEMALEPEIQRIVMRDGPGGAGRPLDLGEPERMQPLHDREPQGARERRLHHRRRPGRRRAAAQRRRAARGPVDRQCATIRRPRRSER